MTNQETDEQRRTRMRGETLEAIANAQRLRTINPKHEVVLVVDDHYAQNALGLASERRSVIPAYDYETASQALEEARPQVVLTDIEFPRSLEYRADITPEEQASLERQRKNLFKSITDKIKERFLGREERIHELDSYASKMYCPGEQINFTKKRGNELAEELQTRGINYGLVIVDIVNKRQIPYAVVTSINHGNVAPGLVALGVCAEQEVVEKLGKYKAIEDAPYASQERDDEIRNELINFKANIGKAIFVGNQRYERDAVRGKDLQIWQEAYELATEHSKGESPVKQKGFFSRLFWRVK
jgi:CheY-like chemotaxis protein